MLKKIVTYADNLRLLLLSATPMYDNANEILWFINTLLINDNRTQIKSNEIFKKTGNFTLNGKELLKEKNKRLYFI